MSFAPSMIPGGGRTLDPIAKYHWLPAVTIPFLMQTSQAGKQHVGARDNNILVRELRKQLVACRCSRSWVNVEDHRDLGVLQLDVVGMNSVAPKQDSVSL